MEIVVIYYDLLEIVVIYYDLLEIVVVYNDLYGNLSKVAATCNFSATTFSITTFSITTFSITTLSKKGLFVTLSIKDIKHK